MSLRPDRHPSAFVLVAGVLAVGLIGLVGGMLARSHDHARAVEREIACARALHAAEAGLAVAVEAIRNGASPRDFSLLRRTVGESTYSVTVNRVRDDRVEFVARGENTGVTRTLTETWRFDPASGTPRRCHER
ncbi:MAG: hypothetical protein ABFS86_03525 [Planctomycetota bacterium]